MTRAANRIIRPLGDDDLPMLMRFLLAHRESSLILASNARRAGLSDAGKPFQGTYLASLHRGEITGVAAHYWNGMLCLQAPEEAAELARSVRALSDRSLNGILGPTDQVSAAATAIGTGVTPVFDSSETLYSLDLARLVLPTDVSSSQVRRATMNDLDTLAHWSASYNVELMGATASPAMLETCRKSVQRLVEGGHQWVLVDGHVLLAACTFNAGIDDCVQIGGVWTPVERRGRGHARAVVAGALHTARSEGIAQAVLFTGIGNRAAKKAYGALGFTAIGTYHILLYRHPS